MHPRGRPGLQGHLCDGGLGEHTAGRGLHRHLSGAEDLWPETTATPTHQRRDLQRPPRYADPEHHLQGYDGRL
eukprot:7381972-Alexandrium_andersonii.AAC.1